MPYLPTAQSFLEQSTLLLQARPSTARITTRYSIPHPSPPPTKYKPSTLKSKDGTSDVNNEADTSTEKSESRKRHEKKKMAIIVLKCYDPISGSCLKYKTNKAAEVGRLMTGLGGCGRVMAGLPPKAKQEEAPRQDEMDIDKPEGAEPKAEVKEKEPAQKDNKGQSQGGGGKKKKKGKR